MNASPSEGHDPDGREPRDDPEPEHQPDEHDPGDREIHDASQDGGDRDDEPREVHLLHEVLAADEAVGGLGNAGGEEGPRHERGEGEDGVRDAIGRDAGEASEDHAEDDHRHERLDHRPGRAEERLAVAHLEVAPGQEVEQLAVLPERWQVDRCATAPGADLDHGERPVMRHRRGFWLDHRRGRVMSHSAAPASSAAL